MSWRPEKGWKQPDTYCELANIECIPKLSAFEAGADAMLGALKYGECYICDYYKKGQSGETYFTAPFNGTLVFIPDEESRK